MQTPEKTYKALFLFAGIGGGALGFQAARDEFKGTSARFETCGAVDSDASAARSFELLTGDPCTVADLSKMTPTELRDACTAPPDVVFTSPPCKGFSGCLPEKTAKTPRYQDMNELAIRGLFLALEAWKGKRQPRLILMENVPRIQADNRGRPLLDTIVAMLRAYGYATRETVHDCGELGNLGQRRKRFLLVARRVDATTSLWYEPTKRPLRSCGDVIGKLPVPLPTKKGEEVPGGPMHRLPRLSAKNMLRLALIRPGKDWRDLPAEVALKVRPGRQNGGMGVNAWDDPSHSVVGHAAVRSTWSSVEDPRVTCDLRDGAYGVTPVDEAMTTVIGHGRHFNGPWQVADPRIASENRPGAWKVHDDAEPTKTVIGADNPYHGANVVDPRVGGVKFNGPYGVNDGDEAAHTVVGSAHHRNAWGSVVDPRMGSEPRNSVMGVVAWDGPTGCVVGHARHDNGANSVADPRTDKIPTVIIDGCEFDLDDKRPHTNPPIIIAADGTWHRPLTTLELAALQGFPVWHNGDWLKLDGKSHGRWRMHIGNAVPPPTAQAIASTALRCLQASDRGEYTIGFTPVWVEPQNDPETRRELAHGVL